MTDKRRVYLVFDHEDSYTGYAYFNERIAKRHAEAMYAGSYRKSYVYEDVPQVVRDLEGDSIFPAVHIHAEYVPDCDQCYAIRFGAEDSTSPRGREVADDLEARMEASGMTRPPRKAGDSTSSAKCVHGRPINTEHGGIAHCSACEDAGLQWPSREVEEDSQSAARHKGDGS